MYATVLKSQVLQPQLPLCSHHPAHSICLVWVRLPLCSSWRCCFCLWEAKKTFWVREDGFRGFLMQPWWEDSFISICSVGTSRGRGVSMTFNCEIQINTSGRASLEWAFWGFQGGQYDFSWKWRRRRGRGGEKLLLFSTYPMALKFYSRNSLC